MKCITEFFAVNCLLVSTCLYQARDFVLKSAEDCLDRYQAMFLKVSRRFAVVGSAKSTSTNDPHLSKTCEWFLCQDRGNGNTPNRLYSESRNFYPHVPESNIWEKRYISGSRKYYSFGDYLEDLQELKKNDDEEEAGFLGKSTIGAPNLFSIAIVAPSGSLFSAEIGPLISLLNMHTSFEESREGDDLVGKFYLTNYVAEMRFTKTFGYMPSKVKTFFNNREMPGAPKRAEYTIPWHESESEWKKVGDDTWVPVHVTSILHPSRRVKEGKEVEATATWDLKIDSNLMRDVNAELLPDDGPIAEVRKKLLANGVEKRNR